MEFNGIRSNSNRPPFFEHYTATQDEVDRARVGLMATGQENPLMIPGISNDAEVELGRSQAIEVVSGNVALLGQILQDPEDTTHDDEIAEQARATMTSGLVALSVGTAALEASKTAYHAVM